MNAPTRICASYISQVGPHSLDVRTMEREVNQIWAPYGIAIEGLAGPCNSPGDGPILKVRVRRIEEVRPVGIPRGTLGNIYFVAGKPTPLIDLWADEAMRVMGGNHMMLNQGLSDPRVRMEMGRLLGRSLAHELGHYLLGSRGHTEEGLMRASYGQQDGKTQDARLVRAGRDIRSRRWNARCHDVACRQRRTSAGPVERQTRKRRSSPAEDVSCNSRPRGHPERVVD